MFTQTTDPHNRSKSQYRKYCKYCHKSNHPVSNRFLKQSEDGEKKHYSYSRSKSPMESFNL